MYCIVVAVRGIALLFYKMDPPEVLSDKSFYRGCAMSRCAAVSLRTKGVISCENSGSESKVQAQIRIESKANEELVVTTSVADEEAT